MRITDINITNLFGVASVSINDVRPVALICGPNGAAKSSIRQALAMAFTGEVARVNLKRDCGAMIHDGAKSGTVSVDLEDADGIAASHSAHVTKSAVKSTGAPMYSGDLAARIALGSQAVGELPPDSLRTLITEVLKLKFSAREVAAELKAKGFRPASVDRIAPIIASGFANAAKSAAEFATEARGDWRAITGETYGSEKAETWEAKLPAGGAPTAEEVEELRSVSEDIQKRHEDALQEVATLIARKEATQRQAALNANLRASYSAQVERARVAAELMTEAQAAITKARNEYSAIPAAARAEAEQGTGALGSPDLIDRLARFAALALDQIVPEVEGPLSEAGAAAVADVAECIAIYEAQYQSIDRDWREGAAEKPVPDDVAAARALRVLIAELEDRAAMLRADVEAGQQAHATLAGIVDPEPDDATQLEAAKLLVERLKPLREEANAEHANAVAAAQAVTKAAEDTKRAKAAHASVVEWVNIANELAPSGIPGRMAAAGLQPLRARLAQSAADTGWGDTFGVVDIDTADGWTIRMGARPYALLSESEKWRADAMLAEAVAHFSGFRVLVLDRMDLLQPDDRLPVLDWLAACVDAGELDSAIVLATLAEAPKPEALPDVAATYWVESGRAEYVATVDHHAA